MVPHRGTNWAAPWLTSQIGRDAVLSRSYGRGYYTHSSPVYKLISLAAFVLEILSFDSRHWAQPVEQMQYLVGTMV